MYLTDEEAWLRLKLVSGLGNAAIIRLLQGLHTPEAILSASMAMLTPYVSQNQARHLIASQEEITPRVQAHQAWLKMPTHHLITLADADYPKSLLDLPDPPILLFGLGDRIQLQNYAIAIIGSRHPTEQGILHAQDFAKTLASMGLTVISGLALGIDAAAHKGALLGEGKTVAVVGTGLDMVYPAANQPLAQKIAQNGIILSEFPLGTSPRPSHFPARNRLIAGLSRGVLVVEAALKSGSLITAKQALELGREVFAIPGSIHSPLSKGCHALIKSGAKLVENVEDIIAELNLQVRMTPTLIPEEKALTDPIQEAVFRKMGYDPVSIDDLVVRLTLGAEIISAVLLCLEMEGSVICLTDGRYQRCVK